jgi:L-fuculose-phosphate aldolase
MMHLKGYIGGMDGNLSARFGGKYLLTTPSGLSKGMLDEGDLLVVDMSGKKQRGKRNPSSELRMHLKVYELRPDIQACVHAHPPVTTAFSVAGIRLSDTVLPEQVFTLGQLKFAEYATPTTDDVPKAIEKLVRNTDVLVLIRHGSLTLGKDLTDAYMKLETLEHSAVIVAEAMKLSKGRAAPIPEPEVKRLWKIHEKIAGRRKTRTHNDDALQAP